MVYSARSFKLQMKERLYIFAITTFLLSSAQHTLYAQHKYDSLQYDLPLFELIANRWNVDLYSTTSIDSTPVQLKLHNRITDAIRQAGNNYIRSYGPGRLTGYSIEGATSGQTVILWENIPLQNPLNAYTDLSLYEFASFDQLSQTANSDFTILGNGSMVPALKCSTLEPKAKQSLKTAAEIGSFGSSLVKFQFEQNHKKWISKTTIGNQSAKSDFPYEHLNGEITKLEHAENQAFNFQHSQWIKHKNDQNTAIHFWYHQSQKNLPRPFANIDSSQKQADEFLNVSIQNNLTIRKNLGLSSFIFYQINSNNYEDADADLYNDNRFESIQFQSVLKLKSALSIGTKAQFFRGKSMNYEDVHTHFIQALFANFNRRIGKTKFNIDSGIRVEWSDRFSFNTGGHLSSTYFINKKHKITFNGEKTFRYPTLNDLYWIPGGNTALNPENAYGLRLKYFFKYKLLSFRINAFSRHTSNMIIWIPNGFIWSPENIQQAWARGTEANMQYVKTFDKVNTGISLKSTFTKATNLSRINQHDESVGKQIIYTPYLTGFWNAFISWKKNQITLNHEIQGKQYTNRDNSQSLDPYTLLNLRFSKQMLRPKAEWNIAVNLNNILGQDYQLNLGWPMPRQNFQIQISYKTISE